MIMIRIGFSFHLRSTNRTAQKIRKADGFKSEKSWSGLRVSVPQSASRMMVAAAEMIRPRDADFSPSEILKAEP